MRRLFSHRITRLLIVVEALDTVIEPGDDALERVDLLLLADHRPVQRVEIMLEMRNEQFQLDDAVGK